MQTIIKLYRPQVNILKNAPIKLINARKFAIKAHGNQKLSDGQPYVVHLDLTVNWLLEFGYFTLEDDLDLFIAMYLHDTVEDTNVSLDEIEYRFGKVVRDYVWRLTDEPGATRKEKKLKTYPKIVGKVEAAKVSDRITNATYSNDPVYRKMYQSEQPEFESRCRSANYPKMWNFLNEVLMDKTV